MLAVWYRQTFTDWVALGVIVSPLLNVCLLALYLRLRFSRR